MWLSCNGFHSENSQQFGSTIRMRALSLGSVMGSGLRCAWHRTSDAAWQDLKTQILLFCSLTIQLHLQMVLSYLTPVYG